jgi:FPC/CPF motif-containing protein YcgG
MAGPRLGLSRGRALPSRRRALRAEQAAAQDRLKAKAEKTPAGQQASFGGNGSAEYRLYVIRRDGLEVEP